MYDPQGVPVKESLARNMWEAAESRVQGCNWDYMCHWFSLVVVLHPIVPREKGIRSTRAFSYGRLVDSMNKCHDFIIFSSWTLFFEEA